MSVYITDECINCGACEPECPTQAISAGEQIHLIDPEVCAEWYSAYDRHACQSACPVECCLLDPTRPESHASLRERTEPIDPAAAVWWSSTQVEEWIAGRTQQMASMAAKSSARRSWRADAAARDAERVAGMKGCRERLAGLCGNADPTAWREPIESQDPPSVAISLIALSSQVILHTFNSPAWLKHTQKANAALGSLTPEDVEPAPRRSLHLVEQGDRRGVRQERAVKISCRPRLTNHGDATRTAVGG